MNVKKGDTVVVVSGKDKGKKGKVLAAIPKKERILVEGVNMITKHQKATPQMQQGGLIHQEGSIHQSNVMHYCPKCKQGVRAGSKVLESGKKVKTCKKCGEEL